MAVGGYFSPVSSHGLLAVPDCVQISFFYKDTRRIAQGPILRTHFNLITSLRDLSSDTVTFLATGG